MEQEKKNTILKTNDLSIGYSSKKEKTIVQKGLNLELEKGSLTCLLGNNGVGKSTLLRTLANMQPAISGSIFIANKNCQDYSPNQLSKKISIVLTEAIPPSNLTVFELVALGRQPYTNWIGSLSSEDKILVDKAIKQTQITDLITNKVHELSDGQKQRVMIARALAQDTEIIILDEPTAHLDIHHKIAILKLLQNISKTLNKSILIATHEINFALQLSDILWLMHPKKCLTGVSDMLINNQSLQELFNSDLISFDTINKNFTIKNV